jgi:cardiolipin synthase
MPVGPSPFLATVPVDPLWILEGGALLHLLTVAFVTTHCLRRRREATSAILWIFVSWSFPIVGPLLFLMFGINRVQTKGWRKRRSDVEFLTARRAREHEAMPLAYWRTVRAAVAAEPEQEEWREVNTMMNALAPDYPLLGQNRIVPLVTGDEAFPQMLAAIESAKHHIHLQTFILGNDEVARRILDALRRRAEAGVTVRVLYDRMGSTLAHLSGLLRAFRHVPNMRVIGWTQVSVLRHQFQINLRNHRKVLVVDGRIAFTGGLNIASNNVSTPARPADRDYHFTLEGPIVQELQYAFLVDWYFMTDENPDHLLHEAHFPPVQPAGDARVRLLQGGPSSELDALADSFFAVIMAAQHQIIAVTPYFVPPADLLRAFRVAALRGVDVRIVVPHENNHVYAGLAGRALYEDLLIAGVRIFERQPPFLHGKAMLVDDRVALVGSANLDVRSLRLNYETNLAVYDSRFANALKRILLEDIAASTEVRLEEWNRRSHGARIAENFCNLLTPIL